MRPAEVLALVDDQFSQIRKRLDKQMHRTGELQIQLDQIHQLLKELVARP